MRVVVTGATGFVGGAVSGALAAAGHEVIALGRHPTAPGDHGSAVLGWDLGSGDPPPLVSRALRAADACVHAAAHVAPWGPEAVFRAVTVDGTARLLERLPATTRLVVVGTASVYDPARPQHGTPADAAEDRAPVPSDRYASPYARAKAAQEQLVLRQRPDALVLRPRAVWGPGDRALVPRFLARVRAGLLPLPAGGRHPMSTCHVDSLVAAVLAGLDRPGVGGPVNVADATPVRPAALLEQLFNALDRQVRIVPVPTALAVGLARTAELAWAALRRSGEPPVTRYAVETLASPRVLHLGRLHDALGIRPDIELGPAVAAVAARLRATSG